MRNLAGNEDADRFVQEELFVAGIELVKAEEQLRGEVPTMYTGKLGPFTFRRAWYYWVVEGPVPLAAAQEMYAQEPYGKRDVRVAGHCGCPPPGWPWVNYEKDGTPVRVLGEYDRDYIKQVEDGTASKFIQAIVTEMLAKNIFVDTQEEAEALATEAFVDCYHIDSQAGLKVFVDTVRKHL